MSQINQKWGFILKNKGMENYFLPIWNTSIILCGGGREGGEIENDRLFNTPDPTFMVRSA